MRVVCVLFCPILFCNRVRINKNNLKVKLKVKSFDKSLKTIFYNFLFYYFSSIGYQLFINVMYNFLLRPLFTVLSRYLDEVKIRPFEKI